MNLRKFLSVGVGIVILSGCMSNQSAQPAFASKEINAIKRVKIVSIVDQSEIEPQIAGTLSQYGVLIDFAMNSLAARSAEKRISPYRDILSDYDVREVVNSSINRYAEDLNFEVSEIIVDTGGTGFDPADHMDNLSDEKLLTLKTTYSFNPSFNYIEVRVTATLYLEDFGESVKKEDRFLIKSWFSQYQSPKRMLRYGAYSIVEFNEKIENIYKGFSNNIEATSNKGRKLRLAKKRNEKIKKLRGRPYIKNSPPVFRGEWDENNVKQYLTEGIGLAMKGVFKTPKVSLSKEEFNNGSAKIPYHSITSDYPRYFLRRTRVSLVEQDDSDEHAFYLTKNNNVFIVPNGEMLSHQEWKLEFD